MKFCLKDFEMINLLIIIVEITYAVLILGFKNVFRYNKCAFFHVSAA